MLLLAIICPPLYFLCVKKWAMFLITLVMAVVCLPLILFVVPPLIIWAIASVMAIHHYKTQKMIAFADRHAEKIGQSVAANLVK